MQMLLGLVLGEKKKKKKTKIEIDQKHQPSLSGLPVYTIVARFFSLSQLYGTLTIT